MQTSEREERCAYSRNDTCALRRPAVSAGAGGAVVRVFAPRRAKRPAKLPISVQMLMQIKPIVTEVVTADKAPA
jgi:predicted secreted protein